MTAVRRSVSRVGHDQQRLVSSRLWRLLGLLRAEMHVQLACK